LPLVNAHGGRLVEFVQQRQIDPCRLEQTVYRRFHGQERPKLLCNQGFAMSTNVSADTGSN
jgi:hypothetical protein